jgi:hypothetical protein
MRQQLNILIYNLNIYVCITETDSLESWLRLGWYFFANNCRTYRSPVQPQADPGVPLHHNSPNDVSHFHHNRTFVGPKSQTRKKRVNQLQILPKVSRITTHSNFVCWLYQLPQGKSAFSRANWRLPYHVTTLFASTNKKPTVFTPYTVHRSIKSDYEDNYICLTRILVCSS